MCCAVCVFLLCCAIAMLCAGVLRHAIFLGASFHYTMCCAMRYIAPWHDHDTPHVRMQPALPRATRCALRYVTCHAMRHAVLWAVQRVARYAGYCSACYTMRHAGAMQCAAPFVLLCVVRCSAMRHAMRYATRYEVLCCATLCAVLGTM